MIDGSGEDEVVLRESAGTVRRDREQYFIITDINVRVMPVPLRDVGDIVDELHGFLESIELEGPGNSFAVEIPFRNLFELPRNVFSGEEFGHKVCGGNAAEEFWAVQGRRVKTGVPACQKDR